MFVEQVFKSLCDVVDSNQSGQYFCDHTSVSWTGLTKNEVRDTKT